MILANRYKRSGWQSHPDRRLERKIDELRQFKSHNSHLTSDGPTDLRALLQNALEVDEVVVGGREVLEGVFTRGGRLVLRLHLAELVVRSLKHLTSTHGCRTICGETCLGAISLTNGRAGKWTGGRVGGRTGRRTDRRTVRLLDIPDEKRQTCRQTGSRDCNRFSKGSQHIYGI